MTPEEEQTVDHLRRQVAALERALKALRGDVMDLSSHSEGVAGLHRNGDVATWDELLHSDNSWLGKAMHNAGIVLEGV